jgi:ABC-type branched-subunit amino acid transport system ATPase component
MRGLPAVTPTPPPVEPGLEVEGLIVRFGGNVAVENLSFNAPCGRLTGLIGPNGAGKTTTFNACTGLLRPSAGAIRLFGCDVTRQSPAARARAGLGRTFQRIELCQSLSVAENVALGREGRLTGASPWRQIFASRAQRIEIAEAVDDALRLCALTRLATRPAGSLSTGERRLVELARALAGGCRLLLLDEPSSGLDSTETAHFAEILENVVTGRGTGVLLVEHDMTLVMRVCEYLHVIDFGVHIFEGSTAQARASAVVRAAYLGSDEELGAQAR